MLDMRLKSEAITNTVRNQKFFEWIAVTFKNKSITFWTEDMVWEYIKKYNVPYNPLYNDGFLSIGCQPCTRAVKPGEDVRSGRWWWEDPDKKECGLHIRTEGKV